MDEKANGISGQAAGRSRVAAAEGQVIRTYAASIATATFGAKIAAATKREAREEKPITFGFR